MSSAKSARCVLWTRALMANLFRERHLMDLDGIVRAPEFPDTLEWIHTKGRRLALSDFRGKLLLLDFWTYG